MRVLVTGGAGYIGSVVAEGLLAEGHAVLVYDDLSRGHREAVPDGAAFVRGDLLDADALREAVRRHRVEAVAHLGGETAVAESVLDPARYYRANVVGGLTLLGVARECGVGLLVFSSSCAVYGEPAQPLIDEDDPTRPASPYGETKLAFERALGWYGRAFGLRWVALRFFNAAGATETRGERHDPETHLVPLVLETAAGRRPDVTIHGGDYPTRDGTCVRDYVHVTDLARAHVLALDALARGRPSAAYNLGCGGQGYTVREVIQVAREVTGREIPVRVGPRRPGDPAVLIAGNDRIARDLGWRPARQDLREIVGSAWAWMQGRRY